MALAALLDDHSDLQVVTWSGQGADLPRIRQEAERFGLTRLTETLDQRHRDLFQWVVRSFRLPTHGLGLKEVAQYFGIPKISGIRDGIEAETMYRTYRRERDRTHKGALQQQLVDYNRDDLDSLVTVTDRLRTLALHWRRRLLEAEVQRAILRGRARAGSHGRPGRLARARGRLGRGRGARPKPARDSPLLGRAEREGETTNVSVPAPLLFAHRFRRCEIVAGPYRNGERAIAAQPLDEPQPYGVARPQWEGANAPVGETAVTRPHADYWTRSESALAPS